MPTLLILRPQDVIQADFHQGNRLGAALDVPEPFRFVRNYLQGRATLDRQAVWGSADDATWIVLRYEEPARGCRLHHRADARTRWVEFEETAVEFHWPNQTAPLIREPNRNALPIRHVTAAEPHYAVLSRAAGFPILGEPSDAQGEIQREIRGEPAPIPPGRLFSREEIASLQREILPDPTVARALRGMRDAVPQMGPNQWGRSGGMPSNRDITDRTTTPPPPPPAPKAAAERTLGRCQHCEHFYDDHGDEDQCPGDHGGDPRHRPTWAPPEVARMLEIDADARKPADSHDIHAERYRMIELD